MNNTKHSLQTVLDAIDKGITRTGTAKVLGCTPETVYHYMKRWKTVDDALKLKRRELVDLAEMGLRGAVLAREPWAVAFTLRTLGKDEGYTERHEVTGANGNPIPIQVFDHGSATAAVTARSGAYRLPPGQDEGSGDGPALGEDVHGG